MSTDELLDRIVINPNVMVGKPTIRGTRLTVELILGLLAAGATEEEIRHEYPGLTNDDFRACYLFAERTLADITFVPAGSVQ